MHNDMTLNAQLKRNEQMALFKAFKVSLLILTLCMSIVALFVDAATTASMSSIYTATQTNIGGGAKVAGYIGGLFALFVAGYMGKWTAALGMGAGTIGAANWASFNDTIFGAVI